MSTYVIKYNGPNSMEQELSDYLTGSQSFVSNSTLILYLIHLQHKRRPLVTFGGVCSMSDY